MRHAHRGWEIMRPIFFEPDSRQDGAGWEPLRITPEPWTLVRAPFSKPPFRGGLPVVVNLPANGSVTLQPGVEFALPDPGMTFTMGTERGRFSQSTNRPVLARH